MNEHEPEWLQEARAEMGDEAIDSAIKIGEEIAERVGPPPSEKLYNCTVRLMDTGIPFESFEEAKQGFEEWANEMAEENNCTVVDVEVMEDSGS